MKTKSQETAADIAALLKARNSLLWIVTREEARVEGYLAQAATAAGYIARTWDVAQGAAEIDGAPLEGVGDTNDPDAILAVIGERARDGTRDGKPERGAWVLRDLPVWLSGPSGAKTLRQVRNLARTLSTAPLDNAQALIVLSPSGDVPPELSGHATVIEWPMPDRAEIARAEQIAGRSVDRQVLAAGVHSHDGGKTWVGHR